MEDYSFFRLWGHGPLEAAVVQVVDAITFAREHDISKLLIDTTKWTGHESPDTLERYTVASEFAKVASSTVKLAMIVRPEMMDPEKFEVTVAKNRGMIGNVFDSERDALAWLLDPKSR